MPLFDWLGNQFGSLFGSTSPGAVGSSVYGPPSSLAPTQVGGYGANYGLLDPSGIRQQAFFSGLGSLSQGLLAAGLPHPAAQGSLIPQALAAFQPAYAQGIQSGGQMAALEQQARDQQLLNQARASNPAYANLPTAALVAQLSRPYARDMTPAEIAAAGLTPGLPWQRSATGEFSVPQHDPRVQEAGARATATGDVAVRGIDLGFTGQRLFPSQGGGGAVSTAQPGTQPSAAPRTAPPGTPGGTQPITPPSPAQREAITRLGGDPDAYPGGPHDPYRNWQPGQPDLPIVAPPAPTPVAAAPAQTAQATAPPARSTDPQLRTTPGGRVFGTDPAALERARAAATQQNTYVTEHIIPEINNSVTQLQNIQRMRTAAADPNMQFGPGAGAANQVAEFLRSWGGEQGASLANRIQSSGFAGLQSLSASQTIAGLGGSLGRVTDADARMIAQTVPNPLQSRETFQRFLDLVQERATVNMQTAHNAYRRTVPDWNPQTDAISAHLGERLDALGIDPGPILNPPPRQQGTAGGRSVAPATTPPGGGAATPSPPPPPNAPPVPVGTIIRNPATGERREMTPQGWRVITPGLRPNA